jgi:hypothetical protein
MEDRKQKSSSKKMDTQYSKVNVGRRYIFIQTTTNEKVSNKATQQRIFTLTLMMK